MGVFDGKPLGQDEGMEDGFAVGLVGKDVGMPDGTLVGSQVGITVG